MKTRTNALLILAMLTELAACGPDGEIAPATPQAAPDAGAPMAPEAAAPKATTPEAPAPGPTAATPFLGRWSYVAGDYTVSCDGQPAQTTPADGTVTFDYGAADGELVASDGMGCNIPCKVAGDACTASPGFTCPGGTLVSLVYTLKNGALREQGAGSLEIDGQPCALSDDAVLIRD